MSPPGSTTRSSRCRSNSSTSSSSMNPEELLYNMLRRDRCLRHPNCLRHLRQGRAGEAADRRGAQEAGEGEGPARPGKRPSSATTSWPVLREATAARRSGRREALPGPGAVRDLRPRTPPARLGGPAHSRWRLPDGLNGKDEGAHLGA